eukprot:TRINITY_DN7036_c0_g4_i2.p1 TRINITY_DN7036_c0_g4~~TRINITY_DN7036_c0_g4_i2.p1  ORF type:complete len:262 (-),score=67.23 TRINITY_DN7036_c0_g4_i2:96-881(-)
MFVSVKTVVDGIALVEIKREPVNSMNLEVWQQLLQTLDALEQTSSGAKAVVFSSGLVKSIFTAGHDLNELYALTTTAERYTTFQFTCQEFLCRLYTSRLITVAAIKGACPAGGCILSLCCDFRVMTQRGHIGLNEVALGVPVPKYWCKVLANVVGNLEAERLLLQGTSLSPKEALRIKLIDEIVPDESDLFPAAQKIISQFLKLPDAGRAATKKSIRTDLAEEWMKHTSQVLPALWAHASSPTTIQAIGSTLARLSKKSNL